MAVSAGPRGKASDTTANASVTPPASANQRCRANRLIRLHSMDKTGDSQIAFGVKQVTFVTLPLHSESICAACLSKAGGALTSPLVELPC